jgi:hypothetical protein
MIDRQDKKVKKEKPCCVSDNFHKSKKKEKKKKRKGATKPWRTRISADNYRIVVVVRRVRRAKRERGHLKVNGGLPR